MHLAVHNSIVRTSLDRKGDDGVNPKRLNVRYLENECYITGMDFLSDKRLIVCDNSSCSVKVINTEANSVESYMTLSSGPRGITAMSNTKAAVTLPDDQCIQIITLKPGLRVLTVERTIQVEGECSGIDFNQSTDMFAVTYTVPPKLERRKVNGDFEYSMTNESEKTEIFGRPLYVRFHRSPSSNLVYVSDMKLNKVLQIDIRSMTDTGTHIDLGGLEIPRGLYVTSNNDILVCGHKTHNICRVSEYGEYRSTLVNAKDGLELPCAMTYSELDKTIYVSAKTIGALPDLWDNIKCFPVDI